MRRGLSYHNRRSSGGYNPFSQLGPTLDLTFAGNVTNLLDPNGFTLDTNFIAPQYLIGAQYTIWETGMGLVSKTFSDIITFTRASSATFTGSNGLIQSAATNVPRFDYDPVTLAAKGLLIEEQRTNLLTYSEQFDNAAWTKSNITVTANSTAAPDGTTTADTFVESTDAVPAGHYVYQSPTLAAGQSYTLTCYAKAISSTRLFQLYVRDSASTIFASSTFNLTTGTIPFVVAGTSSITNVGNGWYRLTVTGTAGAAGVGLLLIASKDLSGLDYIGNGSSVAFIWGAQLEAGSFATSYIPTVASQVTRAADTAAVNTLSPWYNATEGTLFAEAGRPALGGNSPAATLFTSTTARIQAGNNVGGGGTTEADFYVQNVGDQAWLRFAGAVSANTTFKIAGAYKSNDFAASANGGTVATDTSGTVPSVTSLLLGANGTIGVAFNGWLRRITYYPRRLSNAELQAITA